jgi:hypothetical protein
MTLNITALYHYAECRYAEFHYAKCRNAECRGAEYQDIYGKITTF